MPEAARKTAAKHGVGELAKLTEPARTRQDTIAFAGFLVQEDEEAVYIADRKGTWVVSRADVAFLDEWPAGSRCAPDIRGAEGRPVQVGVKAGATIHEIRPWKMLSPGDGLFQRNVGRKMDEVFTLGGDIQPSVSGLGANQLAAIERAFARQLGWDPRDPCTNPVASDGGNTSTATIVCSGGECWWGHSDKD